MIITIIIAFFSLISLIILHELGHFILAKKFGVKVEEFGIGYPPRLFGKKIGGTIYSLNLLPFGAFVKIYGQEEEADEPWSFTVKPIWQRALIILGGVVAFWLVSAILLSIVMTIGVPTIIEDGETHNNLVNPKVQIVAINPDSPAEEAGLEVGDIIMNIKYQMMDIKVDKIGEVQRFTETHRGQEITLRIQRGKEVLDVVLTPRVSPPEGEGPIGIALVRTALKSYPWYQAPFQGILATANLTWLALKGWGVTLISLFQGRGVPAGVEVRGIVGIFELFARAGGLGLSYFLQFIAVVSIYIALFNILPIPVLDGGHLLFLAIEKIRGKAINQKVIQRINTAFFALLILLMVWVTIRDISRFF